ncbi:uncharacterized protein LOC118194147 [Stegodyphus dumicola]|uniref:uncharacterized protein LOC118194147 n=1 Tax=Stegodyphus dumicola TaxID=202533 RepID=UPI0015A8D66A|nr:uncharacterized protein LOC118194147 [Stegodyphus dumicola]XP_035221228.1 uncharacterized protein LOC118194147 [Stegodyphus dumicola]
MKVFLILLVASAFTIATCDDEDNTTLLIDPRDISAIEDKLTRMDFLEKVVVVVFGFKKENARDDKCIPIGGECAFWSAPNCCGIRTRCNVFDTLRPTCRYCAGRGYISKCREYNLGVWLDIVGGWFLGK